MAFMSSTTTHPNHPSTWVVEPTGLFKGMAWQIKTADGLIISPGLETKEMAESGPARAFYEREWADLPTEAWNATLINPANLVGPS